MDPTLQEFLRLSRQEQISLLNQEIQTRGVMDDVEHGLNFYLLILACLSATGAASYGAVKWYQFIRSTCTIAFRPSRVTSRDIEMLNRPFQDDPSAGAAFDAAVARESKGSNVPKPVKDAAKNIQRARSRESSPAGSSRSSGSGSAGPSRTTWVSSGGNYRYRDVGGRREWKRKNSKGEWVRSSGPK